MRVARIVFFVALLLLISMAALFVFVIPSDDESRKQTAAVIAIVAAIAMVFSIGNAFNKSGGLDWLIEFFIRGACYLGAGGIVLGALGMLVYVAIGVSEGIWGFILLIPALISGILGFSLMDKE